LDFNEGVAVTVYSLKALVTSKFTQSSVKFSLECFAITEVKTPCCFSHDSSSLCFPICCYVCPSLSLFNGQWGQFIFLEELHLVAANG